MPLSAGMPPALAVPQYWHRAAGLLPTLMAQAESKQRVKFAREHVVAASDAIGPSSSVKIKNTVFLFISLLVKIIS